MIPGSSASLRYIPVDWQLLPASQGLAGSVVRLVSEDAAGNLVLWCDCSNNYPPYAGYVMRYTVDPVSGAIVRAQRIPASSPPGCPLEAPLTQLGTTQSVYESGPLAVIVCPNVSNEYGALLGLLAYDTSPSTPTPLYGITCSTYADILIDPIEQNALVPGQGIFDLFTGSLFPETENAQLPGEILGADMPAAGIDIYNTGHANGSRSLYGSVLGTSYLDLSFTTITPYGSSRRDGVLLQFSTAAAYPNPWASQNMPILGNGISISPRLPLWALSILNGYFGLIPPLANCFMLISRQGQAVAFLPWSPGTYVTHFAHSSGRVYAIISSPTAATQNIAVATATAGPISDLVQLQLGYQFQHAVARGSNMTVPLSRFFAGYKQPPR